MLARPGIQAARRAGRFAGLALLFASPAGAGGARVAGIDFVGLQSFEAPYAARFMETRPTRPWYRKRFDAGVFERDLRNLQLFLRNEGFLTACVWAGPAAWSADSSSLRPRVHVREGPRWSVAAVEVVGGETLAALAWRPSLRSGEPYRPFRLERDRRSGLELLAGLGYVDARITPEVARVDSAIEVRYVVAIGPPSRIGRIVVQGLERTRPHIVLRELQFDSGDRLASEPVAATQAALLATGLFEAVAIGPFPGQEGRSTKDVRLQLVEKPAGDASLGLGYETDERARIRFVLRHQNLRGTSRRAGLDLRVSPKRRLAELSATEPWLLGRRVSFDGAATYEWLHEPSFTVERIEGRLGLRRGLRGRWSGDLVYRARRTHLLAVRDIEPPALRRNRVGGITLGLLWDSRDDYFDTQRGGALRCEVGIADRWTGSGHGALSAGLALQRVTVLATRLRLATALRQHAIWLQRSGEELPLEERLYSGGAGSVRGFARHAIRPRDASSGVAGGRHRSEISAELRIRVARRLDAVLFTDAGQLAVRGHGLRLDGFRAAAGAGLRLRTPLALARADIAFPLAEAARTQVHVGVGQSF